MAYVINKYDGTVVTTVEDGTVNQTLDIKLIGKNYAGYGELQNENFLFMLENFARDVEPPNAIRGQLWYDTAHKKIKFFTGDVVAGSKVWKTTGGVHAGVEPSNPTEGDLWFDTSVMQLKVRTTTGWLVIGPQSAGNGVTQMVSRSIKGTDNVLHPIIAATIEDEVVYIISKFASFTIDATDPNSEDLTAYNVVGKGITLPTVGTTATNTKFRGTATNADALDGLSSAGFIKTATPTFANRAIFSNVGFTVGDSTDLKVAVESSAPVIQSQSGASISVKVQNGSVLQTPLVVNALSLEPGATNTYDLGTSNKKWKTIYVEQVDGISTKSDTLLVSASPGPNRYRASSVVADAWSIAARDSSGSITATEFNGTASRARYADLAEKYLADEIYPIGTVVVVGGEKEVTASQFGKRALGVVSEKPAFMMNSDLVDGTYIALKGRVPVYVAGPVKKGDELIADDNGVATTSDNPEYSSKVFAIALEDNDYFEIRLIECVIL
jgi:hypothetical protein